MNRGASHLLDPTHLIRETFTAAAMAAAAASRGKVALARVTAWVSELLGIGEARVVDAWTAAEQGLLWQRKMDVARLILAVRHRGLTHRHGAHVPYRKGLALDVMCRTFGSYEEKEAVLAAAGDVGHWCAKWHRWAESTAETLSCAHPVHHTPAPATFPEAMAVLDHFAAMVQVLRTTVGATPWTAAQEDALDATEDPGLTIFTSTLMAAAAPTTKETAVLQESVQGGGERMVAAPDSPVDASLIDTIITVPAGVDGSQLVEVGDNDEEATGAAAALTQPPPPPHCDQHEDRARRHHEIKLMTLQLTGALSAEEAEAARLRWEEDNGAGAGAAPTSEPAPKPEPGAPRASSASALRRASTERLAERMLTDGAPIHADKGVEPPSNLAELLQDGSRMITMEELESIVLEEAAEEAAAAVTRA